MRLVTGHVPNTPGIIARVASTLAEAEVDIQGLTVDAHRLRILTDTAPAVVAALKDMDIVATEHPVVSVDVDDRPGALAELARRLADAGINIEVALGITHGGKATFYLRVDDMPRARELLHATA